MSPDHPSATAFGRAAFAMGLYYSPIARGLPIRVWASAHALRRALRRLERLGAIRRDPATPSGYAIAGPLPFEIIDAFNRRSPPGGVSLRRKNG